MPYESMRAKHILLPNTERLQLGFVVYETFAIEGSGVDQENIRSKRTKGWVEKR
jgi:transposase